MAEKNMPQEAASAKLKEPTGMGALFCCPELSTTTANSNTQESLLPSPLSVLFPNWSRGAAYGTRGPVTSGTAPFEAALRVFRTPGAEGNEAASKLSIEASGLATLLLLLLTSCDLPVLS